MERAKIAIRCFFEPWYVPLGLPLVVRDHMGEITPLLFSAVEFVLCFGNGESIPDGHEAQVREVLGEIADEITAIAACESWQRAQSQYRAALVTAFVETASRDLRQMILAILDGEIVGKEQMTQVHDIRAVVRNFLPPLHYATRHPGTYQYKSDVFWALREFLYLPGALTVGGARMVWTVLLLVGCWLVFSPLQAAILSVGVAFSLRQVNTTIDLFYELVYHRNALRGIREIVPIVVDRVDLLRDCTLEGMGPPDVWPDEECEGGDHGER